jgi:hypothetical protein
VALHCEMARCEAVYLSIRQIGKERFVAGRREKDVVLAPENEATSADARA